MCISLMERSWELADLSTFALDLKKLFSVEHYELVV